MKSYKILMFVVVLLMVAVPAFAQNGTKATLNWDFTPPTPIPPACSGTVTVSCISGFEVYRALSPNATPNPATDALVTTAGVVVNGDGTINTTPKAQTVTTADQPMGTQGYYTLVIAKDQAGVRNPAVPSNVGTVLIRPFPASNFGGTPK
jgi:hypothetical protein